MNLRTRRYVFTSRLVAAAANRFSTELLLHLAFNHFRQEATHQAAGCQVTGGQTQQSYKCLVNQNSGGCFNLAPFIEES